MYIDIFILAVSAAILGVNGYLAYTVRRIAQYSDTELQRIAAASAFEQDDDDDLLEEATALVRQEGKCSTSLLQRKYRIGYGRAARLMDLLSDEGVIEWEGKRGGAGRWVVSQAGEGQ